jgi:hypothetical protein
VMGMPPRSRFDEVLFGSSLRNVLRRHRSRYWYSLYSWARTNGWRTRTV